MEYKPNKLGSDDDDDDGNAYEKSYKNKLFLGRRRVQVK